MRQKSTHIGLLQLFSALAVTTSSSSFNATLTCSMVQNGVILKDPGACDTWIECIDNEPIYGKCSTGLFYDLSIGECVDPSSIRCHSSEPCAAIIGNGFVPDPYSCNGYYYCYNGKGVRGECSPGMNFNPGTLDCIRDFACHLVDPNGWCNIVPESVFFSDPLSCQGYHLCWDGSLQNGTCAHGYYFDAFRGFCGYELNVECNVQPLHPVLPGQGICQAAGDFVADNETCVGYYYCEETNAGEFQLIWDQCPSGRFFSPANRGECVDRRQIACEYNRCDGMGVTNIELASAANDGCRGYLMCQDGVEIGSGMCPDEKEYFNEVTQRCTSDVIKYAACASIPTTTTSVAVTESSAATVEDD